MAMDSLVIRVLISVAVTLAIGTLVASTRWDHERRVDSPGNRVDSPARTYSYDYGVLLPSDTGSHTFIVTNNTQRNWQITGGKATCSCLKVEYNPKEVLPGEKLEVAISVKAGPDAGLLSGQACLFANGLPGRLMFRCNGLVRPPVFADPQAIYRVVSRGNPVESDEVQVTNYSGHPWEQLVVDANCDWLRLSNPRRAENEGVFGREESWLFSITPLHKDLSVGHHMAKVLMEVKGVACDEGSLVSSIPVELSLRDQFYVTPDAISFGTVTQGGHATAEILVHQAAGAISDDLAISYGPEETGDVSAAIVRKTSHCAVVKLVFSPHVENGVVRGELEVGSEEDKRSVSVPVMAAVVSARESQ